MLLASVKHAQRATTNKVPQYAIRLLLVVLKSILLLFLQHRICCNEEGELIENMEATSEADRVHISVLLDIKHFNWTEELVDFTVSLINEGWLGDSLNGTLLEYSIADSACDKHEALREFLDLTRDGVLPNAILGCRCSDPTMAISALAAAEDIAVLSPAATNPQLSNKENYPTFSRLVAPDNSAGQVGALVALLRHFGWDRISIINTDNSYAQDLKVELVRAWRGEQEGFIGDIGYEGTVQVNQDTNEVDTAHVRDVLRNVPVDDPRKNSRIVVLLAHHQHAYPILKIAGQIGFQPDTVFIGVDAWTGRPPEDLDTSWMPDIPGTCAIEIFSTLAVAHSEGSCSPFHVHFRLYRTCATPESQGILVQGFSAATARQTKARRPRNNHGKLAG